MYYCENCAKENHWPWGWNSGAIPVYSNGPCELCKMIRKCMDLKSPWEYKLKKGIEEKVVKAVERREEYPRVITTSEFWDCECQEWYNIHHHSMLYCPKCKAERDSQPDSRICEVITHILFCTVSN